MSLQNLPPLHEITGLGRPIDPSVRSNRIAIAGSAAAGALRSLLSWLSTGDLALLAAVSVGAGVFLAWALAREIAPDSKSASYLAMLFAGVVGLVSAPAALVVAILLLATRTLSGTVGAPLRTIDLLVLMAAAVYAGSQPVAWPIVGLLGFAVRRSSHVYAREASTGTVVVGAVSALLFVTDFTPGVPDIETWALLAFLVIAGWRRIRNPQVESRADSGAPIWSSKVGLARLAVLAAIVAGSILAPETALTDLAPAIAAFAAMGLWPSRDPLPETTRDEPITALETRVPAAI